MIVEDLTSDDWEILDKKIEEAFVGREIELWQYKYFRADVIRLFLNGKSSMRLSNSPMMSWLRSSFDTPFNKIPIYYDRVNTFAKGVYNFRLERGY